MAEYARQMIDSFPDGQVIEVNVEMARLSVALRLILAIPQFIVVIVLMFCWWVTSIVAWLLILLTGAYPQGLYDFGVGCLRWLLRVEAYMLLLVAEYPPFSLSANP